MLSNELAVALLGALGDVGRQMNQKRSRRIFLSFVADMLALLTACHNAIGAEASIADVAPLKYEDPKSLSAGIYTASPENKKLLFNFRRTATRSGSKLSVRRDYTYADGELAAQEKMVYEGDDLAFFELKELQTGGEGSATIRRVPGDPAKSTIEFEYRSGPGSQPKTRTEPLAENTLVSDMVGPFLASHWDALSRGEKIKCRYIVVPRRETVGFAFVKDAEGSRDKRQVIIVKMQPSSRLVGALVDPLYFTIDSSPSHHVVQYTGRTTPKTQVKGKWKDLDALTVFDWQGAR